MAVCARMFTVFLIAAYLLVPERLVTYKKCCFDNAGRLRACATPFAENPKNTPPLIRGQGCCDPTVAVLRGVPAAPALCPDVQDSGAFETDGICAIPAMNMVIAVPAGLTILARWTTVPSILPDILTIQSRLNL